MRYGVKKKNILLEKNVDQQIDVLGLWLFLYVVTIRMRFRLVYSQTEIKKLRKLLFHAGLQCNRVTS